MPNSDTMTTSAKTLLQQANAVLYDFDGIIIDSEWPIFESWHRVFAAEGHELAVETYVQCIGSDFDTWSPEKYLEELTGKTYDWPAINAKRQVELEADLTHVETLSGVRETFQAILDSGKKLAVVSSSTHSWVDKWLEKLDLISQVHEVVCRGDAPKIKPAPDLYLEAVRRFALPASECLVIEDSLNGILAGKDAGCMTVAVPSKLTSVLDFSIADSVIADLTELI